MPLAAHGRCRANRCERLGTSLGQPVIVENIGGADGSIGAGRAAHARPDGYTIEYGLLSTHVLNGAFYSLTYDVLNDFAPIAPLYRTSLVIVGRKDLPARDLYELIAWLKTNPNKASAAVATVGIRLLAMYFQKETGTQFTLVPYRGVAPAMQDLVAGQIDLLFDSPRTSVPLIRAGSIRPYVVTGDTRLAVAPDIPTVAEMGFPALSYSEWIGLFAPKGTPDEIITRTLMWPRWKHSPIRRYGADQEIGAAIFPREQQTAEKLGALVKADANKWWPIIKAVGIKGR